MTSTLAMGDSSSPLGDYPELYEAWGFYIGGDTPHVWSDAEIAGLGHRKRLPIYVCTLSGRDANDVAAALINWADDHQLPAGTRVCLETDTLIDLTLVRTVDNRVTKAGFKLTHYGSLSALTAYPATSGGRWDADWTGEQHLTAGSWATQWASGAMIGKGYDVSECKDLAGLWDPDPDTTPAPAPTSVAVELPELAAGSTGAAVVAAQSLLNTRAGSGSTPLALDGVFGPLTTAAVKAFQTTATPGDVDGIIGPDTWAKLVIG